MHDALNERSQFDTDDAEVSVLPSNDAAERHAAVCAGVVEHLPALRNFARSLAVQSHLADDLVQGAILRALAASHQFTPGTNIQAWLFTILRNGHYNQWRSPASRHITLDDCLGHMPVTPPDQEAKLEFCDFRRAFAELVPEQREALMLVGAAGLEYGEAATICGCPVGTVKSRVSRARASVRASMDGDSAIALRRRDLRPISTMNIALALGGAGAALYHRASAQ